MSSEIEKNFFLFFLNFFVDFWCRGDKRRFLFPCRVGVGRVWHRKKKSQASNHLFFIYFFRQKNPLESGLLNYTVMIQLSARSQAASISASVPSFLSVIKWGKVDGWGPPKEHSSRIMSRATSGRPSAIAIEKSRWFLRDFVIFWIRLDLSESVKKHLKKKKSSE
jgi:hypothetical protein